MSSNIKIIRFTTCLSLIFAVLTYAVTVNIETGFIKVNSTILSNSFFLTIFGGAFGSSVVVLICEIQKYIENRKNAEYFLYARARILLTNILVIRNSIATYIEKTDLTLNKNILSSPQKDAFSNLSAIQSLDYTTFRADAPVYLALLAFRNNKAVQLDQFLRDCNLLETAIIQDRVDEGGTASVSASSHLTGKTLKKLLQSSEECITTLGSFLECIDTGCGGIFNWENDKELFEKEKKSYELNELEQFLSRESDREE